MNGDAQHELLSLLWIQTTTLSCVLPEQKQESNIWICSEGCNSRSSPIPLIPSQYVVYFGSVLWSRARFLRSSQQVNSKDTVRFHKQEVCTLGTDFFPLK